VSTFEAHVATDATHELAEGPLWDPVRARVLWVDIAAAAVHLGELEADRVRPTTRHDFQDTVGAAVLAADGHLLVAAHHHLVVADATGQIRATQRVVPPDTASRCNDGACDPAGRFLVGTMALDERREQERLLRLETDGSITVLDHDLTLSNGLAWSPDGGRLYSIDSVPGTVWVRDYDVDTGAVGRREQLLRISDGTPDGMCVDVDGNLWIAIFGGSEVRCLRPDGEQVARIEVPVPNPTSVAFVGVDLATLLITTARHELTDEQLAAAPASGRLFTADVGVRGLPVATWDGRWGTAG
jgi:sugar lactone lactonase YvrE